MTDHYGELVRSPLGKKIAKNLGLPTPAPLTRHQEGQPLVLGEVLLFGNPDSPVSLATLAVLSQEKAQVSTDPLLIAKAQGFEGILMDRYQKLSEGGRFAVVIFDATHLTQLHELQELYACFQPIAKRLKSSGRVIVLGRPECCTNTPQETAVQQALTGFIKSFAKEVKHGIACNVVYVKKGLEHALGSTLRFLMSAKSAYVSGQALTLNNNAAKDWQDHTNPKLLQDKTIAVTGASRGIGAAIAETLAMQGAKVWCLDLPTQAQTLTQFANRIGASALSLDITDPAAYDKLLAQTGTLDGFVHNAGLTMDKTLGKMTQAQWDKVMNVNLIAQAAWNDKLLAQGLSADGKIVCLASIAGIAGNFGQTNYATSKAGVMGLVHGYAKTLTGERTINAVAPGFIETEMTAAMPFAIREAGRRMNAMSQGGMPSDVAHTVAWLLSPETLAVNGQVIRVCGHSVLGA